MLLWVFLILIRAFVFLLFSPLLRSRKLGYPVKWRQMIVAVWGGLRGAVSLALALIVTLDQTIEDVEFRDFCLFYAGGVALLTLTVNASTTSLLIRALRLNVPNDVQLSVFKRNLRKLDRVSTRHMDTLGALTEFAQVNWAKVKVLGSARQSSCWL